MFAKDLEAGYYLKGGSETRAAEGILLEMAAHDPNVRSALGTVNGGLPGTKPWTGPLADLCGCVDTPPPHPGQPLQKGGLIELPSGPRLYND